MRSVLVIDDDRRFRDVVAQCLQPDGWQVIEAEDGETGIGLALQHRPEVVLCDLLMPRCNGFHVCRELRRQHSQLPNTRIVVTTGSHYATDRLVALEAGADEYLVKPIHPPDLLAVLGRLTGATGPTPAAPPAPLATCDRAVRLKFWGVRGSVPTPGPTTVFYGGNTACVEVRVGGEIVILDAGTGIRSLGLALVEEFKDRPITLTLLISHTHWDHIQGFPFFEPAYNPRNRLRILGFEGARQSLESILSSQMESPYFPIGLREMPGYITIEELHELKFRVGTLAAQAAFLNHPGICLGYRLCTGCGDIVYMPDNETFQTPPGPSETAADPGPAAAAASPRGQPLLEFVRDAHVLVIDAQYDRAEYQTHTGWGHSSIDQVVELAIQGGVRQLFLFHHDPSHDDDRISRMVAHARALVTERRAELKVEAAREGLEVVLRPVTQNG